MKMITVSGPPSAGKTSVILKAAACLRAQGYAVGVVKFDCLLSDDDQLYAAAGFPARKALSRELCPDHFFISNVEDAYAWGERHRLDYLITESAGLCNRCSPHIRGIMAVCVIDQLSGIRTPAKIGPMLRLADEVVITKGDVVSQAEREVFEMLKSRLDKEYSCFDGTCNPAGPGHWFKKFLDSDADIFSQQYGIDDNPFLPESVRGSLKREYTGVFYQRYILGQWVAAEGAVYPMFERGRHVSANAPDTRFTWVGVDYGHTNPTAFVRLGLGEDGRVWALEEYYHAASETGARSPRQYAADLIRFAHGSACVVIDPSAEGFILQLHEDSPALRLKKADNAVLEGVQLVSAALDAGKLMFHPRCERLIAEMEGYRWDERARERGEDKPRKEDDHAVDALRYGLMHYRRDVRRLCRQGT